MDILRYIIEDSENGEQILITNCPQIKSSVVEFMNEPPYTIKWEDATFKNVCESYSKEAKAIFEDNEFTEHYEIVGTYEEAA